MYMPTGQGRKIILSYTHKLLIHLNSLKNDLQILQKAVTFINFGLHMVYDAILLNI